MKTRLAAAAAAALLLVLSGCGGSDDEAKAKESLAKAITDDGGTDTLPVDEKGAKCVGDGFVDELGVEKLQKYKILDKDLEYDQSPGDEPMSEADADKAAGVVAKCIDVESFLDDVVGDTGNLDAATNDCLKDVFDEDTIKQLMSAALQGKSQDEATAELMTPMLECMGGATG